MPAVQEKEKSSTKKVLVLIVGITAVFGMLLLAAGLTAFISAANSPEANDAYVEKINQKLSHDFNHSAYDALATGLTFEHVEKLLGPPAEVFESEADGKRIKRCTWANLSGGELSAQFLNGILIEKSQQGLH